MAAVKCIFDRDDKCKNVNSLFYGYSNIFCKVCSLSKYARCIWEAEDNTCYINMPDSLRDCKGYEKCKGYEGEEDNE